jgi:hypothetical protein
VSIDLTDLAGTLRARASAGGDAEADALPEPPAPPVEPPSGGFT